MHDRQYNIITPTDMKPRPKPHEESAAVILSKHFNSDVKFISTASVGTPDILIRGIEWEIKSPVGESRNNIQKNMRAATKQSLNVVMDLRRSRLHQARALGYISQFLTHPNGIKRLIVITKRGKVIEMK